MGIINTKQCQWGLIEYKFQKCEDSLCQNAIICKGLMLNTIKRHLDGQMDGRHILSYLVNLFYYLYYCVDVLSVWIWCLNACHKNERRACCQCHSILRCFSQMFWGQEIVEVLKLESCLLIPSLYFVFHNVLNRGQARNTGRSAWYVRSITLKPICCRQQNVSLFSSGNKQKRLNGSICCTATCMFLSALMVPLQMCMSRMTRALTGPRAITEAYIILVMRTSWSFSFCILREATFLAWESLELAFTDAVKNFCWQPFTDSCWSFIMQRHLRDPRSQAFDFSLSSLLFTCRNFWWCYESFECMMCFRDWNQISFHSAAMYIP